MRKTLQLAVVLCAIAAVGLSPHAGATVPGSNGGLAFGYETSGGTATIAVLGPTWSPDGRLLTYSSWIEATSQGRLRSAINVVPPEGGEVRTLATPIGNPFPAPEFSPTGDEVIYSTGRAIRTVRVDGGGNRKILTSDAGVLLDPTYSPKGSRISFVGAPRKVDRPGIWSMLPDGSGLRRLTDQRDAYADSQPDCSPDARRIVFQRRNPDEKGIAVMRAA